MKYIILDRKFQDNSPPAFRPRNADGSSGSGGNKSRNGGNKSGSNGTKSGNNYATDKTHCKWYSVKGGVCTRGIYDEGRKCKDLKNVIREHTCTHMVDGKLCNQLHKKCDHFNL